MATRQEATSSTSDTGGRVAQRRRTRKAILEATQRLLADGGTPSIGDIAAEADVSRRTVYMHFPSLDELLTLATIGALSSAAGIDDALDATVADPDADAVTRVETLVGVLLDNAAETLPLGRRLIRLTVEEGEVAAEGAARRGHQRVEWLERAVEPLRDQVGDAQY